MWPLYPTGDKNGSKKPQHVLKHAEMQSERQCVQSFGAKSGASAATLFVGLEYFGRYCGLKFKHQIFGWFPKIEPPVRVEHYSDQSTKKRVFEKNSLFKALNFQDSQLIHFFLPCVKNHQERGEDTIQK